MNACSSLCVRMDCYTDEDDYTLKKMTKGTDNDLAGNK